MLESPLEERRAVLASFGIPEAIGREIAASPGAETARCELALYRAAAQPVMKELGEQLGTTPRRPGHVFYATGDPFCGTREMCETVAECRPHRARGPQSLVDVRGPRSRRGCADRALGFGVATRPTAPCRRSPRRGRGRTRRSEPARSRGRACRSGDRRAARARRSAARCGRATGLGRGSSRVRAGRTV